MARREPLTWEQAKRQIDEKRTYAEEDGYPTILVDAEALRLAMERVERLEAALREIRDVWLVHGPSRELSDVVARHAADVTEL